MSDLSIEKVSEILTGKTTVTAQELTDILKQLKFEIAEIIAEKTALNIQIATIQAMATAREQQFAECRQARDEIKENYVEASVLLSKIGREYYVHGEDHTAILKVLTTCAKLCTMELITSGHSLFTLEPFGHQERRDTEKREDLKNEIANQRPYAEDGWAGDDDERGDE